MTFTDFDKLRAISIVNIFETGRPFGEYAALAVLNDGAGISYGISQFTHRSGSLLAVVLRYLLMGGAVGRIVLENSLAILRTASPSAIDSASKDARLKSALRAAAATPEMRDAQHHVAYARYMLPAIRACNGSGFTLPLSLAVVYDSINHGSWETVRDMVRLPEPVVRTVGFEKAWITAYVKARHKWLRGIPRLKVTSYRTAFFLEQIVAGNWQLNLPLMVHGYALKLNQFPPDSFGVTTSAAGHPPIINGSSTNPPEPLLTERGDAFPAPARPPKSSGVRRIGDELAEAFAKYDRIESAVRSVVTRADSAKSLWTTVAGTAWQAFWAVVAFLIGLPREVWLAVAIIAAVLMIIYLYRQFVLGRIREMSGLLFLMPQTERREASVPTENE